jgi:hypothetical protein
MDVGILVLVLGWIVLVAVALQWGRVTNRGASVLTWVGLTLVTWCIEVFFAFSLPYIILFTFGGDAARAVMIATVVVMAVTPVAWAYGLRYWYRYRAADE